MNEIEFKQNLLHVTSRKFGKLFCDYTKKRIKAKQSDNIHYSLLRGKNKIAVKAGRAIKENDSSSYFDKIFHSNEYCSLNDSFNCIIQQIRLNYFDTMYFYLCFEDGIRRYSIKKEDIKKHASILNYVPYQHHGNSGLEGQLHITNKNIDKVNKLFCKETISYNDILSFSRSYS